MNNIHAQFYLWRSMYVLNESFLFLRHNQKVHLRYISNLMRRCNKIKGKALIGPLRDLNKVSEKYENWQIS